MNTIKIMLPTSNQPGQLYGAAKTLKFDNTADIVVDKSGTYTYNAA